MCPDRILYRGKGVSLTEYNRFDAAISDHKPVRAIFEIEVLFFNNSQLFCTDYLKTFKIDARMRDRMKNEMVSSMYKTTSDLERSASPIKTGRLIDLSEKFSDSTQNPFDSPNTSIKACLPLPSSAKEQWWNIPIDDTCK